MRAAYYFRIVSFIGLISIALARCGTQGGTSVGSQLSADYTPQTFTWTQSVDSIKSGPDGNCRITDAISYTPTPITQAKTTLWVRGGGWENQDVLNGFGKYVGSDGYAAIILSATDSSGGTGTNYFLNYYRQRMTGVKLVPIHTSNFSDASNSQYVQTVNGAQAIVITGGNTERLRHLVGSPLGQAVVAAHARGIPVYTNSASTSLIGRYFSWNLRQTIRKGLDLLPVSFLSHFDETAKFGQGTQDLWRLVPSRLSQSFGVTSETIAIIRENQLKVWGNNPTRNLVYVFDSRFPKTANCASWVLRPGETFPLD